MLRFLASTGQPFWDTWGDCSAELDAFHEVDQASSVAHSYILLAWWPCLSGLSHSPGQMGSGVASFTGHIPNLRREVLTKVTEKVGEGSECTKPDSEVSPRNLKSDNERLKTHRSDLDEKYEASELQIKQQTTSY